MARHIRKRGAQATVLEFYIWPLGIGTPHWFDNEHGEYLQSRSPLWLAWAHTRSYLERWRVVRLRCTHCGEDLVGWPTRSSPHPCDWSAACPPRRWWLSALTSWLRTSTKP
ncbi:hypothetical protein [Lentzea sp. NBRC 102530]|uniref:hypothetical protein n=1 Tax=Lentzea sp. NBRC 102530 TaxID=3032201 RepID=UPI0024A46D76|nr:hypothetical protein [Lentzea sp. NBRC 102530]GLY55205.1 hypothetical protein Lesp01_88600 [Lentzea sp. NBRC 102530]